MIRKLAIALGITLGAMLLVPALAFGHADYESSTPGDGETVTSVPSQVVATFSADLDTAGTNMLNVKNASGGDVDNNDVSVSASNQMTISLQSGLPNGAYTVEWATTSAEDGEDDSGTFSFTVQAAAPTTTNGGATPAPGAPTTGFGPSPQDDSGFSVAMLLALTTVGGAALSAGIIMRRRAGRA